jgi:hypothetical protein
MRFQIPQFIETEDKIIGPLSLKQAAFLGLGVVTILIVYASFGITRAVIIGVPIGLFCFALAFLTINGRPFEVFVKNYFRYVFQERIYVWRKPDSGKLAKKLEKAEQIGKRYEKTDLLSPSGKAAAGREHMNVMANLLSEEESQKEEKEQAERW